MFALKTVLFVIFSIGVVATWDLRRPNIVDFENVARDYVDRIAREYNRKVSWWDLYGKHSHLAERPQYSKYKISVSTENVKYGVTTKTVDRPGYVYSQWFHNSQSSQPIQGHMSKKVERATTFTWTLKEGIKIGVEIGATVGIPGEFGASVSVSTELSLEASQSQTKSDIETFTVSNTIMVAPNTSVKAEWTVTEREMEIPWEADVNIDGYIAIWFSEKYNGHWLWFHPISSLYNNKFQRWGSGLKYRANGIFTGVRGLQTSLRTFEYPLNQDLSFYALPIPGNETVLEIFDY